MNPALKNWQMTIVGVLGAIAVVIQPISDWIKNTAHITPIGVLALLVACVAAIQEAKHKELTAALPPAAPKP